MGVSFPYLRRIADQGLLEPGSEMLDIGCSNLYNASVAEIADFLALYGIEDGAFAEKLAEKSAKKTAFLGELIERCGIGYEALDFAVDYKVTQFDLNNDELPEGFRNRFDLVLNFGTTEHLLNQAHAFRIMHEAAKPDGFMHHQLPAGGYFNHGYFLYTGRFFFELAAANGYDLCFFEIVQGADCDIRDSPRDFARRFPAARAIADVPHPLMKDTGINCVYRRDGAAPFQAPMELSTAYSKPWLPMGNSVVNRLRIEKHRLRKLADRIRARL